MNNFQFIARFLEEFAATGRYDIVKLAHYDHKEKLNQVTWLLDYCKIPYGIEENADLHSVYCNSWFEAHGYFWNHTFRTMVDILRRLGNPDRYVNVEIDKVKPFVEELEDLMRAYLKGLKCSFDIYKTNYQFIVEILD